MEQFLKRFDGTSFDVMFETGEEFHIGTGDSKFKVRFHEDIPYTELMKSTSLALGEAYMDGRLEIDGDLVEALDEVLRFQNKFTSNYGKMKKLMRSSHSMKEQKEEVCSHYDIGNEFYELWLDDTLSYSCAYFREENDTLEQAQYNKVHHILKKLQLSEEMSLLDIGCGWGFLLIEAAKLYKIHGVGITLSEEQAKKFATRIKEEGLEDYLQVKVMDYRELKKSGLSFDRVVSVGMIEHVGRDQYEEFFENVDAVLKESGIFVLHYISGKKEYPGDPWLRKYIFPGGMLPSLREIIWLSAEHNYFVIDIESLRRHYVRTLLQWYKNFENSLPKIKEMFDERFIRMWRLYLCSCAATFHNGIIDLHQIVFTKGVNNELPMTRENLYK